MRQKNTVIIKLNIKSINKRKIELCNQSVDSFLYETISYKVLHEYGNIADQVKLDINETFECGIFNLFTDNTIENLISFMAENDIRPYDEYYIVCDWAMNSDYSYDSGFDYDFEVKTIKIIRTERKTHTDKWCGLYKLMTGNYYELPESEE